MERDILSKTAAAVFAKHPMEGYFAWSLMDNFDGPRATRCATAWRTWTSRPARTPEDSTLFLRGLRRNGR
jgi:hypothetical protein